LLPQSIQAQVIEMDKTNALLGVLPFMQRAMVCDINKTNDVASVDATVLALLRQYKVGAGAPGVHAVGGTESSTDIEGPMQARVAALEVELATMARRLHQQQQGSTGSASPAVSQSSSTQERGARAQGSAPFCYRCNATDHLKAACAKYKCKGCGKTAPGHLWRFCPNPTLEKFEDK
jgi:hypothetical protein